MESNNAKFSDDPSVTLTIRLIMQGKVSHLHTIIDFLLPFAAFSNDARKTKRAREIYPSIIRIHQAINLSSL
jgi:hypothetical protein